MRLKPLRGNLKDYLSQRNLSKKFAKQLALFIFDPRYPSLNTERLEPKEKKVYSFRIDKKYRAIFIFTKSDEIEIIDVNSHYD